jgi:hypothetical protein
LLADTKENHKICEVKKITANVSKNDLLYRNFRLPEINAEGIRITLDGIDGEQILPDKIWSNFAERLPQEVGKISGFPLLQFLNGPPEQVAQELINQLETKKILDELNVKHKEKFDRFAATAADVKARLQNVKTHIAERKNNPLNLIGITQELQKAATGIIQLSELAAALKTELENDGSKALEEASKRDSQKLTVPKMPTDINKDELAEVFIGKEVKEQCNKILAWSDWTRSLFLPEENAAASFVERLGFPQPKQIRGETIFLPQRDTKPEVQVDTLNFTGQVDFGAVPVFFNGTVRNIAQPLMLGETPLVAQLCLSGNGIPKTPILPPDDNQAEEKIAAAINPAGVPPLFLTLNIDRLNENNEDQLILCCPAYTLPQRQIGVAPLLIDVSPGTSRIDGVISLRNEKLSGQFRIMQNNVRLAVSRQNNAAGTPSPFHSAIQESLNSLRQLTVKINISGTLAKPQYTFESDLTPQLLAVIADFTEKNWGSVRDAVEGLKSRQGNDSLDGQKQQLDSVLNELKNSYQELLPHARSNKKTENDTEKAIQRGLDKVQEKLPGLLDKLRKK